MRVSELKAYLDTFNNPDEVSLISKDRSTATYYDIHSKLIITILKKIKKKRQINSASFFSSQR